MAARPLFTPSWPGAARSSRPHLFAVMLRRDAVAVGNRLGGRLGKMPGAGVARGAEQELAPGAVRLERTVHHLDDAHGLAGDGHLEEPPRLAVQLVGRDVETRNIGEQIDRMVMAGRFTRLQDQAAFAGFDFVDGRYT